MRRGHLGYESHATFMANGRGSATADRFRGSGWRNRIVRCFEPLGFEYAVHSRILAFVPLFDVLSAHAFLLHTELAHDAPGSVIAGEVAGMDAH